MLHDLTKDKGHVALKRAAEDKQMEAEKKDVTNLFHSRNLLN